eukprot:g38232.t1
MIMMLCGAIANATGTSRFVYVFSNTEHPHLYGAVTLFRKDIAGAECDPQCNLNAKATQGSGSSYTLAANLCWYCAFNAACKKGWEYLGVNIAKPSTYTLRKQV